MARRIALLLHLLPDGTSHVDLLVARGANPAPEDRTVRTWRCANRPDRQPPGSVLDLERIGDHRAFYLGLAVPRTLDGDRGVVTPLRSGEVEGDGEGDELRIAWDDGGRGRWLVRESPTGGWRLDVLA